MDNPVALTADIPKSPGNAGELPFQRIGKCLDQMIAGTHGLVDAPVSEEPAEGVETEPEDAVADDATTVSTT